MSTIAEKIKTAHDQNGMLRRALERIIQLYTDRSHFVYELLQNAEDAAATCIKFIQYSNRLEVYHNGKPFTTENLQSLCDIGKSDKVGNLNQIGEFGVGFKSVFGICETVRLYSNPQNFHNGNMDNAVPFAVEIVDFVNPRDISQEKIDKSYTTKFVFPFAVGKTFSGFKTIDELNHILFEKLQNLGITTLLFMKNLELIEYQIYTNGKPIEGQYLLDKKIINDHCEKISALGISNGSCFAKESAVEISYLKFSRTIDQLSKRTVDIAFPIEMSEDGKMKCLESTNPYISVYFPTETESKIRFIVQGPYRTTPNRSSIPADDADNIFLARETAKLLHDSIIELRDRNILDMSFIRVLPLEKKEFEHYSLFEPLYAEVRKMFECEQIVPSNSKTYTYAKYSKIARLEKLTNLLSDEQLSSLINDGNNYRWLPAYLTENNRTYEIVYKYFISELKINIIRPEDLKNLFQNNPSFLPKQSNDWLVELYSILENIPASFLKSKNETNMLTADIIKTDKGTFAAAYRKTENKQYIPNIFLPSNRIKNPDINFVNADLYQRCRYFFDNILQLEQPNEYECFVKDIKTRYTFDYVPDEEQHIDDVKQILKYLKYDEYKDEISKILGDDFLLKCNDGNMRNAYQHQIFCPISNSGIQIELYFKNINDNVYFVDLDFYIEHEITEVELQKIGVKNTLIINDSTNYSLSGRWTLWNTTGDFRRKFSILNIKDAIRYISKFPNSKDSIIKSKTIMAILFENESKLAGNDYIRGSAPNKENETCELIKILRGELIYNWNEKWLFTDSLELVSQRSISKYDLSTSIYGKLKPESKVYGLLGFRKTEADEVDDLKKKVSQKQLDAYFENELERRFGVTSAELTQKYGSQRVNAYDIEPGNEYIFPVARVKNWEALRKHAEEMLCFSNPVRYAYAFRRIRVSNKPKEARAYLMNMYRYDGVYKYACQMCHDSCSNIERVELFDNPKTELDPMNLCLCPNCAAIYREIRRKKDIMIDFRHRLDNLKENDISNDDHVSIEIDEKELWFTQVHIAEIFSLLRLTKETEKAEDTTTPIKTEENVGISKSGLSVYSSYENKYICRKKDGFYGIIEKVNENYICVKILRGKRKGETTKIQLSFLIEHPEVYTIVDESHET